MRPRGFDATRRNRKIGSEDFGWRKQSPAVVPERWGEVHYEQLRDPVVVHRTVHRRDLPIVVEPTLDGFVHACTPDDIACLLNLLPAEALFHVRGLGGIILRQPTRKAERLAPVWGRLVFASDVEPVSGAAVYLEAQRRHARWGFGSRQSVEAQHEFARLEQLAPLRRTGKRQHEFEWGLMGLRRWLLYHTLIHEVGHWVDFLLKVEIPWQVEGANSALAYDAYWRRPVAEREAFAHRFSDEQRDELIRAGKIPFARIFDEDRLRAEGLDPGWFQADEPAEDEAGPALRPLATRDRKSRIVMPPRP